MDIGCCFFHNIPRFHAIPTNHHEEQYLFMPFFSRVYSVLPVTLNN